MTRSSANARIFKRSLWLAGLGAAGAAGLVSAQPSQPSPTPLSPPPSAGAPAVREPAQPPQETPPPEAPAPATVAPPALSEEDVEAAPDEGNAAAEEKPAQPPRRARYDVAVLQALDKVTAESLVFEAPVGKAIRYKGLIFTVRACERATPEEPVDDSIAYLTIDSQPRPEPGRPAPPSRQVFKGWMYASSPGLHPLEHPVYDAWVISCRAAAPSTLASR